MTYENMVKDAKKAVKAVDTSVIKEHLAVEFDVDGKGEGAFYVEFTEKCVEVEPYEYYDHDFRVRTNAETAMAVLKGDVAPSVALAEGKIIVEGDENKVMLLEEYLKAEVKPSKKASESAKKSDKVAKKPVPKKVSKKPAKKASK